MWTCTLITIDYYLLFFLLGCESVNLPLYHVYEVAFVAVHFYQADKINQPCFFLEGKAVSM